MERMEGDTAPSPDDVKRWAWEAMQARGAERGAVTTGFAHGSLGLLAGHTQYMEGFAVLMGTAFGVAVALRPIDGSVSRIVHTNDLREWTWSVKAVEEAVSGQPVWVCVIRETLRRLGASVSVEAVVASAVPPACIDARLTALSVATTRAFQKLLGADVAARSDGDTAQLIRSVLSSCTKVPYSTAYPLAVQAASPPDLTLVDTRKCEHLPLEAPPRSEVRWALITVGEEPVQPPSYHEARHDRALEALRALNQSDLSPLTSFSELEHRNLARALDVLPEHHRATARHLVGENRRVQRLVKAVKKKDWQLFGALLLMSHHSLRDDWNGTDKITDFVVSEVRERTADGMYGACLTGRGHAVLVAGQALALDRCLDSITAGLRESFDAAAEVLLL